MAKSAKQQASVEFTDRDVRKAVSDVMDRYARIESARGSFMLAARREREGMQAVFESLAAKGVPQRVSKVEIQIIRLIERIKKLIADLEAEDRKMVEKLARAQDDRRQLSLFSDVPKPPKPPKEAKAKKAKPALNVVPIKEESADAPSAA